jgi:hypothetical protein
VGLGLYLNGVLFCLVRKPEEPSLGTYGGEQLGVGEDDVGECPALEDVHAGRISVHLLGAVGSFVDPCGVVSEHERELLMASCASLTRHATLEGDVEIKRLSTGPYRRRRPSGEDGEDGEGDCVWRKEGVRRGACACEPLGLEGCLRVHLLDLRHQPAHAYDPLEFSEIRHFLFTYKK